LSSLGEHVLTRQLDAALHDLASALEERGFRSVAEDVAQQDGERGDRLGQGLGLDRLGGDDDHGFQGVGWASTS
jgi:hypothetical protein